jgi:nicotinamide-nucleotide amidase
MPGGVDFSDLMQRAERIGALLKERRETVTVAESSTGGLISATLLGVAGASAYFLGGAVVYTQTARRALLDIQDPMMAGMRASTEAYALLLGARERAVTLETGRSDRVANMHAFAAAALDLLETTLRG